MNILELKVPPVGVGIMVAGAAWGAAGLDVHPLFRSVPVSVVLVAAGFAVALAGVAAFRKAKTTVDPFQPDKATSLVSSGVYRFSRNPMYLGMLLVLLGWAVYLGDVLAYLVTLLFIPYMTRFQIKPEERVMRQMFGEEFDEFAGHVRRWI